MARTESSKALSPGLRAISKVFFSQIEGKLLDLAKESLLFSDMRIRNRMADFVAETGIKSGIIPTMITTFGVRLTQYAALAQVQITMDDLFV